jgi:hypothetical protein
MSNSFKSHRKGRSSQKIQPIDDTPVRTNSDSGVILGSDKAIVLDGAFLLVFKSVSEPVTTFTVTAFDQSKYPKQIPRISFDPSLVRHPSPLEIELATCITEEFFPMGFTF